MLFVHRAAASREFCSRKHIKQMTAGGWLSGQFLFQSQQAAGATDDGSLPYVPRHPRLPASPYRQMMAHTQRLD
jgi:hypothetical protein